MSKTFIPLLILAACIHSAAAAEMTAAQITAKMEETDKSVTGIQFEFTQEIAYNLTNEKQVNNGSVSFMKPENLNVKMKTPLEQEIITNGKKVWIYTPKYNQFIVDNWKKWAASSFVPESLINFSKEWKDLKSKYVISYEGSDAGKYVLLFKPIAKESFQMRFWIDEKDFVPVKILITGENVTIKTEMINRVLNPKLDKKIFVFNAPAGIDVMNLP
jgi:chaperone LolA